MTVATHETLGASRSLGQRIDKWLWHARLCKTRSAAQRIVDDGRVRLTTREAPARVEKASQTVRPGDVITLVIAGKVRVVRILACAERRGPAPEARQLYEELL